MPILSWETPLDRRRAEERERERGEAIRGLREVEDPISPGGMPAMPPMGMGAPSPAPSPPPLPSVPTSYTPREVSARAQSFGVSIPQFLGAPQEAREEVAGDIGAMPRGEEQWEAMRAQQEEFERRYQDNLDTRLETLERRNRQRAVDDLPPLTVEGEERAARQHALDTMRAKGAVAGTWVAGMEKLGLIDVPRQFIKEEIIEPIVPEFELPVPREALIPLAGPFAPGLMAASLAERAAGAMGAPEVVPRDVKITSAIIEEAASWVLDPVNLVFFIGPELKAIRAAGGALRVANQIRKTKNVPAFVKAAMRVAQSEAGGAAARGGARGTGGRFEEEAVRRFGTAENIYNKAGTVEEPAGFILQDGRILKASRVEEGVGTRLAHEEVVADLMPGVEDPMRVFLNDTGSVRAAASRTDELFLEIPASLTDAQRRAILQQSTHSAGTVIDVVDSGGKVLRSLDNTELGTVAGHRQLRRFLDDLVRNPPAEWGAPGVEAVGRGVEVRPDFPPYDALPPESSGYVYHTTGGFGETGEKVLGNIRRSGELTAGVGQDEVLMREAIEAGEKVPKEFGIPKVYFDVQPAWEYGGDAPLVLRMKRSKKFSLTEGFDAWYTKKSVPAERLEWYGADGTWHPVVEPGGPGTFAPVGPAEWETKIPVEIGEIEEVGGFPARFPIKIRGGPAEGMAPGEWLARTEAAGAARPPMGPEMPPPVKPPVPGGLPPPGMEPPIEGAIAKLSTLIKQAKKPLRGQTLLRHEEMQRRFGQVAERLRTAEGTPIEVAARARAALGGERAKIAYEPVLPLMTGEDVQALFLRANTFDFGLGRTAENVRAADALTKALLGELPQQAEQVLLEQVFGKELLLALRGKGPISHQVYRNLIDLMALPKTALTFLDHSFPGRQGIKLAASHPAAWTKSAWYGIKAGARERVAQDMVRARALDSTPILVREGETVRTIPYGKLKEMAGVYEASFAEAVPLAAREEAFVSHWARAIPLWGKAVKISERMYITSGNEIRHDVTRGLLQAANRGGEPIELETAKALAALNNRASGRGTIGIDEFAPVLNSLFFAPRYRISPVQWTAHLLHRDPVVRKEAARQVVSFVTAGATLMALLKYSGLADVNIDPNSADFGKARVGKTRIDIWAHLQQIARSVSMLITGERMTSTGEKVDVDREEIAWRYFRTGLAPIPGLFEDIRAGETIIGEEMEPTAAGVRTQLFNRLTPLAWQDIIDGVREEGARGGMISALALAGIGIMTYETYAQERARDFQKETGMEFDYANSGHWAILRTNPALKEKYGELGDVAQETQDFLTEEMTRLGLPDMARQLSSGTADPQLFVTFRERWEDFEGIRAKSAARMAFGRDRDPADDPVFQRYMEIDRNDPKYKDPVTFEIDYGAYRRDKDAAFDNLDPAIQMAFQAVGAPDPEVAEWATLYVMSRNLRRQLYGMSKWEGLTPEQSRRLDQFTREVSRRAPQIAEQLKHTVTEASVAQALAEEQGAPGLAEWFIALQSSTKRNRMRDPDYEGFIAENKVGLQLFYPELYSQALLERIGAIEGAPPGMQPMEPTGMQPMTPMGVR